MSWKCKAVIALLILLCSCSSDLPVLSTRTLITAAHLGEIDGYTCIYFDEVTDYAVYLKDDYTPSNVSIGTTVTLANTTGTVSSISPAEFSVQVDNISKIVPGVSGTTVSTVDGNPVGFISGWDGAGSVRCIFY